MKKHLLVLATLVLCLCWGATVGAAPKPVTWRGSGGWGAGLPYGGLFQPGTMVTVTGEVLRLERVAPLAGMAEGYALWLRTRDQSLLVHLGPAWFLERQDYSLEANDHVEVTGSRIQLEGKPLLLATAVVKKDKVLSLRAANGLPLWSAWRKD